MTEKRYYLHKHTIKESKFHDRTCHKFMNLQETEDELNLLYAKYSYLKNENEQLKEIIVSQRDTIKRDNEWENKAIEEIRQLKQNKPLYCYMVSFYNYSDSEFLPIFHEKKFTKQEFQEISNEIANKIQDNEHNKWGWGYPDTFLEYAKEYGFQDIDILEVETINFKVTTYGDME